MDSQNEEISSILDRFRRYLMNNEVDSLFNEFNHYRSTWSKNKFRMFLTNVLIVMRSWSNINENWDEETNQPSISDQMQNAAQKFFFSIIDFLRSSSDADETNNEVEFEMWKRILTNRWSRNEKFYIDLFAANIEIPSRLTSTLYNDMFEFYVATESWSSTTKIILIDLGFSHFLIHDNVFLGCNHILSAHLLFTLDDYRALTEHSRINPISYQNKLITSMNTPEKMKIFLDHYPNVNLSELTPGNSDLYQQRIPLTIFDRLLKMEVHYYENDDSRCLIEKANFTSTDENVRAANLTSLFKQLLERGAQISINLDSAYYQNHRLPLFVSTLGFYLLSLIRFRDTILLPSIESSDDVLPSTFIPEKNVHRSRLEMFNFNYICYVIKRASTFSPQFRSFFFKHLVLSCPMLHKEKFVQYNQTKQNPRLRLLHSELLEHRSSLTLKERCRLRIKEEIHHYPLDLNQLNNLPITLRNYLSFDLFNPNFVSMTLETLNRVQARLRPTFFDELQFHEHDFEQVNGHYDWEDQIPEDMDDDDDDDDGTDYDDHFDDDEAFDVEDFYSQNDDDDDENDDW